MYSAQIKAVLPHFWEYRNMRIAVANNGAQSTQFFHHEDRRRLAHIIYVFLIRNTQNQYLTAFY
ncbi:hypothetical protein D3C79_1073210 [compost metagenome]